MKKLISVENFLAENDIGEKSLRQILKMDDFPKVQVGTKTLIINDAVTDFLVKHMGEDLIGRW